MIFHWYTFCHLSSPSIDAQLLVQKKQAYHKKSDYPVNHLEYFLSKLK